MRAQLEAAGARVHDVARCTRESSDLYSYRRDAAALRAGWPAWSGSGRDARPRPRWHGDRAGPTEVAASLAASATGSRAPATPPTATPVDVRLVVVTKFFPASDVRLLADLGVTDVAENRHQEAEAKAAECADLGLAWHFVGGLQSNKAAAVARYAACVHSVDRPKLVGPLDRGAQERARGPTGPRASRSTCCSR